MAVRNEERKVFTCNDEVAYGVSTACRFVASKSAVFAVTLLAFTCLMKPTHGQLSVDVEGWSEPNIETYDPNDPPPDLPEGLEGDTDGGPAADANYEADWDGTTLTIKKVMVKVSGGSRIRIPKGDDSEDVLEHEKAHDRLAKDEYNRAAKQKFEDALRDFVGMTFVGEGATPEERGKDADEKAGKELDRRLDLAVNSLLQQMHVLNKKFDNLTDHGRNPNVDTPTGEAETKKERDQAPSGEDEGEPDKEEERESQDGEAKTRKNKLEIETGEDDKFSIRIDSIVPIGLRENGAIHLSDTTLQIRDRKSGRMLMDALVFEVSYFHRSSVPDYAGMVQGYLDIPPDYAGGIDNFLGSKFLSAMASARDDRKVTRVWFFCKSPLFDKQGQARSLKKEDSVSGKLVLGVDARTAVLPVVRVSQSMRLSDRQKKAVENLTERYSPRLAEVRKRLDRIITPSQLEARAQARHLAEQAGKKGLDVVRAGQAALKLSPNQIKVSRNTFDELRSIERAIEMEFSRIRSQEQKPILNEQNSR